MWKLLLALFTGMFKSSPPRLGSSNNSTTEMDEGDYHSGPHGYSPNTAYPDTEYGDLDWSEDEEQ